MKTATMLAVLTMTLVSASQAQAQFNRFFKDPLKVVRKTAKDPLKAVRGTTDAVAGKGTAKRIAGPLLSKGIPAQESRLMPVNQSYIDINGNVYDGRRLVGKASKQLISGRWYWVTNYNDGYGKIKNRPTSAPTWYTEEQRRRSNPPTPQLAINPHTGWVYNVQTGQNVARAQRQVTNQFDQYGRQVVWYRYGNLQQTATPQPINNGGGNNGGGNNGGGNANGNNLSTGEQIAVGILGALLQASQNNR
jgi:hypothetical protein